MYNGATGMRCIIVDKHVAHLQAATTSVLINVLTDILQLLNRCFCRGIDHVEIQVAEHACLLWALHIIWKVIWPELNVVDTVVHCMLTKLAVHMWTSIYFDTKFTYIQHPGILQGSLGTYFYLQLFGICGWPSVVHPTDITSV